MTPGETIYVNMYASAAGLGSWAPYEVACVFSDGNAILVSEPNFHMYTGKLAVGTNLRRLSDSYDSTLPGPS